MIELDKLAGKELMDFLERRTKDETVMLIIKNVGDAIEAQKNATIKVNYFEGIGEHRENDAISRERDKFLARMFAEMHMTRLPWIKLNMGREHKAVLLDLCCIERCWDSDLIRVVRLSKNKAGEIYVDEDNQISVYKDWFPFAQETPSIIVLMPTENLIKQLSDKGWADPNLVMPDAEKAAPQKPAPRAGFADRVRSALFG